MRIFLDELSNAIRELWVIERETLRLVQGNETFEQELFVLVFQGQRETVDNTEKINVNELELKFANSKCNKY